MIEKFNSKREVNKRGTKVAIGQPLYAVRVGDLYFIWCYTDKTFAEKMNDKMSNGPVDERDRAANWRRTLGELVPSGRTTFR